MALTQNLHDWKTATRESHEEWINECYLRVLNLFTVENCYLLQEATDDDYYIINLYSISSTTDIGYGEKVAKIAAVDKEEALREIFFDGSFVTENNGIVFGVVEGCDLSDHISSIYDIMNRIQLNVEPIEPNTIPKVFSFISAFIADGYGFVLYTKDEV
jgi:hypothetical protein